MPAQSARHTTQSFTQGYALGARSLRLRRRRASGYRRVSRSRRRAWADWVAGKGKRGSVRVIYFGRLAAGQTWLLVMYVKSVQGAIPAHLLKAIREEIENG